MCGGDIGFRIVYWYTLENERLEPKNHPIEKEHHLSKLHFEVPS